MKTFASLFTGFGGADLGAIAAGLTPAWGVEKDPGIAYRVSLNSLVFCQDVKTADFRAFDPPDWLHASPPCVRASTANNGKETPEDMEFAEAICRAIQTLKPQYFSLEKAANYLNFEALKRIESSIKSTYYYDLKVLDCADYGIPQNRRRLFLVASTEHYPYDFWKRIPTKQVGWFEAIADLIPTLPECRLTESQYFAICNKTDYLPTSLDLPSLAIQNAGNRKDKDGNPTNTIRLANEPIWTMGKVRVNPHQVTLIVDGKVLRPNIQCYARWQTFPDSYQWSGDLIFDTKGICNAVPPRMMEQIINAVKHPRT